MKATQKYYLDTNALRSLASCLPRNANDYGIYSSVLAVSEIISGMNKQNFERRKSIIKSISTLNFSCIKFIPEMLVPLAYSIFDSRLLGTENLLVDLCIDMDGLSSFEELCKSEKYSDIMKILHAREDISKDFTEELQKQFLPGDAQDLYKKFLFRWDSEEDLNNNLLIVEHHFEGIMIDKYGVANVKKYNHSQDLYFLALAKYEDKKTSKRERPGRNDYIDLQHIMYLFHDGIMVTDDKRLTETIQEIDPSRVISTETLKSIIF